MHWNFLNWFCLCFHLTDLVNIVSQQALLESDGILLATMQEHDKNGYYFGQKNVFVWHSLWIFSCQKMTLIVTLMNTTSVYRISRVLSRTFLSNSMSIFLLTTYIAKVSLNSTPFQALGSACTCSACNTCIEDQAYSCSVFS